MPDADVGTPVPTQTGVKYWADVALKAVIAASGVAGAGTLMTRPAESAKDRFTGVVDAALADGDYDLARRLIDALDPPGAKEGGK